MKPRILMFIKPFWKSMAKHRAKGDLIKSICEYADVMYWYHDGHAPQIVDYLNTKYQFKPDFIFHYDNASSYLSPDISGLEQLSIPKGYYVIDIHDGAHQRLRKTFIENHKIDLIFSVSKYPFLRTFPEYAHKFRWLPWSINPRIIKDWNMPKDIDYLLLGLVGQLNPPYKGVYPFREAVYEKMKREKGFKIHLHPGHTVGYAQNVLVNERYAKELNRAQIFFTCGSIYRYPVMKFFEAPGCRSLLLAEPNEDIFDLGFKDGQNFVACDQNNFFQKARFYLKHESVRTWITDNGYNLIHNHHTNDIRAQQFVQNVTAFLNGDEKV
ncbi:MAG: glycosyltransferase [Bacillaceae bacterium]|nr:glycosyltransferase [Bacillaceae bacterium]